MDQKNKNVDKLAKIIWDYLLLHQKMEHANAIMILGTHDSSIAYYGAELFINGWAPYLIITGGTEHPPDVFKTATPITEAEFFTQIAIKKGVPEQKIIIESEAKNTGENFDKTEALLRNLGHNFDKFIVVQKPYMERRTYATGKKRWPTKKLIITSPPVSYEDYINSGIPKSKIINTMVGDLQRINVYPAKGFQIPQSIPPNVWDAFEELVRLGFNERLIKD